MHNSRSISIWPEELFESKGMIQAGFTMENPNGERVPLWYRVPERYRRYLTKGCEPFVLASLFTAMRTKSDLVVHGEVSPIMLRNLEDFQAAWSLWRSDLYTRIDILADIERDQISPDNSKAISSFSGGVDSCFAVWRHGHKKAGRKNQDVGAGLMIHGYDIPIGRRETFTHAASKAEILLSSLGMEMINMEINLKQLKENFAHTGGTILASCLMLLQGGFTTGLIAGGVSYSDIYIPWGTNPITDPLLSSGVFSIIYDSLDVPRHIKVREIANWPEARQHLRVCLSEDRSKRDENCCKCEKCIRTILNFRALGSDLPPCFAHDVSLTQIFNLIFQDVKFPKYYQAILEDAKKRKIKGAWLNIVRIMLFLNSIKLAVASVILSRKTKGRGLIAGN